MRGRKKTKESLKKLTPVQYAGFRIYEKNFSVWIHCFEDGSDRLVSHIETRQDGSMRLDSIYSAYRKSIEMGVPRPVSEKIVEFMYQVSNCLGSVKAKKKKESLWVCRECGTLNHRGSGCGGCLGLNPTSQGSDSSFE